MHPDACDPPQTETQNDPDPAGQDRKRHHHHKRNASAIRSRSATSRDCITCPSSRCTSGRAHTLFRARARTTPSISHDSTTMELALWAMMPRTKPGGDTRSGWRNSVEAKWSWDESLRLPVATRKTTVQGALSRRVSRARSRGPTCVVPPATLRCSAPTSHGPARASRAPSGRARPGPTLSRQAAYS
jgi:hypothetical protein